MGSGDRGQPFILCLLARLAAFWWVLQSFVVKEDLLTCSPNKFLAAINTNDSLIVEFGRWDLVGREDFGL